MSVNELRSFIIRKKTSEFKGTAQRPLIVVRYGIGKREKFEKEKVRQFASKECFGTRTRRVMVLARALFLLLHSRQISRISATARREKQNRTERFLFVLSNTDLPTRK